MIREVNFGDVADVLGQMESAVAQVRAGEHGEIRAAACVMLREDGTPIVFGWGADAGDIHAIGLLHLGASWLALHEVRRK